MSEYEWIRKMIGERKFKEVCNFLENNKQYFLSDVYYRSSVWEEMEIYNHLFPVAF